MTSPTSFSWPVLLFLVAATGCGEGGRSEPVDTFAAQVEARGGVPFAQEGAVVSLVLPDSVAAGDVVAIELQVSNETSAPLDLYLRGRDVTFDIAVTDSTGDAVWRRLEGEVTQAVPQLRTLAPGAVIRLRHDWDQKSQRGDPVGPGRYVVRGSVTTDGRTALESGAVTLVIKP